MFGNILLAIFTIGGLLGLVLIGWGVFEGMNRILERLVAIEQALIDLQGR